MLDDLAKKQFAQLDDDMPAQRANALEMLRERLLKQTPPLKFRDILADIESAVPKAQAEALQRENTEYKAANEKAKEANQKLTDANAKLASKVARLERDLKAALWVKANWKMTGAVAGLLVAGLVWYWAYDRYWSRSDAVNSGLQSAAASATWGEGWSEPVAARIGGESWWLLYWGNLDAGSYSDSHGHPVEMRCLHLYANPAQPDSGQYRKPSPWNFLGWVKWPELAIQCKTSPIQRADK
jgi:hypothetical protein